MSAAFSQDAVDCAVEGAVAFELRQRVFDRLPPRKLSDERKLRFARLRRGESGRERVELHADDIELVQLAPDERRDDDGSVRFEPREALHLETPKGFAQRRDRHAEACRKRLLIDLKAGRKRACQDSRAGSPDRRLRPW